ncbi:MAG: maleylpyruvate isomerase family mycothiol-dependent enzyme [Acidimicrobiales bacterium]
MFDRLVVERTAFVDLVEGLSAADWSSATLCDGWSVAVVAGHVLCPTDVGYRELASGLVRARFSLERFLDAAARRRGGRGQAELVAALHASVTSRTHPPGTSYAGLAVDCAVHSLDVAIPTGRDVTFESERLRWLLERASRLKGPFGVRSRIAGLRLEATDVGWSYGTLPEGGAGDRSVRDVMVSGPGDALLLAMLGRTVRLDRLAGHGVEILGARA